MYLNLIELAESFGVPEKVVEDWIREQGLPHTTDRGRLLFDRARVAHWAAFHGLTARTGFLAAEGSPFATAIVLEPMVRAGKIWRDVPATGAIEVLERVMDATLTLPVPVRTLLRQRLRSPGGLNWAPVGGGFALPHFSARVTLGRDAGLVAALLLTSGLPLTESAVDAVPVTRLFFFVPPSPRAHLDLLGRLSRAILSEPLRGLVQRGAADDEILAAMAAFDRAPGGGEGRGHSHPT